ncbi:histidine kinase N-terminal domain-containing protein [Alicyclobacillus fastidiosus]|uniref:histidine kinase n=1 Tax=Alicyclobacillus fastidiosus TaxID=392011 RepID=A0ABV5ABT4_9BACL|nr:histidine kinase N-terminal domain-containing protein [Alicyclobacillus fastidiosus]WEH10303.1 histidine kinase N-terminal domain-containing protein [Alicyclobacillus fastidiosus]
MANAVEARVAQYLEKNKAELMKAWMARVMMDPNDPFEDEIEKNGYSMLYLLISYLRGHGIDHDRLKIFAQKVSFERLEANINIGGFVYNVNIGRSEILNHMHDFGLSIHDLHPVIYKINDCFDMFLYFAVHHYTELKNRKLEEQSSFIEQTHKDHLTILGQMSSSFVHEFRNPLTSVMGFVQLLQERYPTLEYLDVLTKELNQLKFRINQFLLVSKKGVNYKEVERFHLATACEEMLDFLYPMVVGSDAVVVREVDDSIYLSGYPDEFRQVLINIFMNSLDALSHRRAKTIHIKGRRERGAAVLTMANNGPPVPADIISSIFEPFVSTKKLGTGIGLYVCRKIIEEHHGTIECESNEDWTTFRIVIPITGVQGPAD